MSTLANNKKALFDLSILEKYESGILLTGQEVKSVRRGSMRLTGSFVSFAGGQAYLVGAHIGKYGPAGPLPDYQPTRRRKLLLTKKELRALEGKAHEKGLTVVPMAVYTQGPRIKVSIGVGRGKKKYDKRELLKRRDTEREMKRALKGG